MLRWGYVWWYIFISPTLCGEIFGMGTGYSSMNWVPSPFKLCDKTVEMVILTWVGGGICQGWRGPGGCSLGWEGGFFSYLSWVHSLSYLVISSDCSAVNSSIMVSLSCSLAVSWTDSHARWHRSSASRLSWSYSRTIWDICWVSCWFISDNFSSLDATSSSLFFSSYNQSCL